MRIAVFGARGRTGRLLVDEALERGHELSALVRATVPELEGSVGLVLGDAREVEQVEETLRGADAVVSVMTIEAGTEPTTALSDATRVIVEVMERRGPTRFVLSTNSTVFSDREIADPYRILAEEHRRNVAHLRESRLAWTVLAPMLVRDGEPGVREEVVDAKAAGKELSRTGLARASLDALDRDEWIGHVIGIADTPVAEARAG